LSSAGRSWVMGRFLNMTWFLSLVSAVLGQQHSAAGEPVGVVGGGDGERLRSSADLNDPSELVGDERAVATRRECAGVGYDEGQAGGAGDDEAAGDADAKAAVLAAAAGGHGAS